jgi:hypothetical protein
MLHQQKIIFGEMRASDRPAENYLGCALLINATVERRTQRPAMPHHEPQDAFAFGTFESLHGVAANHRRHRDGGPFNLARTTFVFAHVRPLITKWNARRLRLIVHQ